MSVSSIGCYYAASLVAAYTTSVYKTKTSFSVYQDTVSYRQLKKHDAAQASFEVCSAPYQYVVR